MHGFIIQSHTYVKSLSAYLRTVYVCFAKLFNSCVRIYAIPFVSKASRVFTVTLTPARRFFCFCPLVIFCGPSANAVGCVTKDARVLISCSTGGEHPELGFQERLSS